MRIGYVQRVKEAAEGRELEILAHAGFAADLLDGRGHPCPWCGGDDRFYCDRQRQYVRCRQCFEGDLFDAVAKIQNSTVIEAAKLVEEYLGKPNGSGKAHTNGSGKTGKASSKPAGKGKLGEISFDGINSNELIRKWAAQKIGVNVDAALAAGARGAIWSPTGQPVVAFRGWPSATAAEPSAVVMLSVDGSDLGNAGRDCRVTKGSRPGLIICGGRSALAEAETVVLCEGPSDTFAVAPFLPPGFVAVTNTHGAGCSAQGRKSLSKWLATKKVILVPDSDKPGLRGMGAWARDVANCGGKDIRWATLPYPIVESHGKDLRDWINEGHGADDVAKLLADAAQCIEAKDARPTIEVTVRENLVVGGVITAIATDPDSGIYQRGGRLARVVREGQAIPDGTKDDERPAEGGVAADGCRRAGAAQSKDAGRRVRVGRVRVREPGGELAPQDSFREAELETALEGRGLA